jgi:hypothetical protein
VDAAANAARGGATSTLQAVRDGGRLATITLDPPQPERGIGISSVYVRPNAGQLDRAVQALGGGRLEFKLGARFPLAQAYAALERAIRGARGARVMTGAQGLVIRCPFRAKGDAAAVREAFVARAKREHPRDE